jgi:hypothetical protein
MVNVICSFLPRMTPLRTASGAASMKASVVFFAGLVIAICYDPDPV